jgi:hypothetical protein
MGAVESRLRGGHDVANERIGLLPGRLRSRWVGFEVGGVGGWRRGGMMGDAGGGGCKSLEVGFEVSCSGWEGLRMGLELELEMKV